MFLVMLFIHVGKRLSSSSHIIFKTGVLKNFAIFTRKHLCWSLFLIKLQDWRLVLLLKRDSNTGVFLWIMQDFEKLLFYGTSVYYTFRKVYVVMNIRCLKVIFYYCKIRSRSRKNFMIDWSKFLVKRCLFLSQNLNSPSKMFLLFNHQLKICKGVKAAKRN